jgi:hypothetical protein
MVLAGMTIGGVMRMVIEWISRPCSWLPIRPAGTSTDVRGMAPRRTNGGAS